MMVITSKEKKGAGSHGVAWLGGLRTVTRIRAVGFYFVIGTRVKTPHDVYDLKTRKGRIAT